MKTFLVIGRLAAVLALLNACSASQLSRAEVYGQLFCAIATAAGPVTVALVTAAVSTGGPVAVLAMGATDAFVNAACAVAQGVPVSPPPVPAAAPLRTIVAPVVA